VRRPRLRRQRDPKLDRLGTVHLFEGCTNSDLQRIAALSVEVDAPAGRVLAREGDPGHEAFVIEEGTALASMPGRDPVRIGPGECFGELALLEGAPRSATVRAETDMRLIVLNSREFGALMDAVPRVADSVRAAVAKRRQPDEGA
jgi:CRP-like cAMP-binding protein